MKILKTIKKSVLTFSVILFIGSALFILYYMVLQPLYSKHINDKYRNLYYSSINNTDLPTTAEAPSTSTPELPTHNINSHEEVTTDNIIKLDDTEKGIKNDQGILVKFSKLLEINTDIKGWLSIPGTTMDYPVMQAFDGSDYYLTHDFEGTPDKNGCLYIDGRCNVTEPSKNIVIHGHNMESTKMMFYELPNYDNINYFVEHPTITFDSIYSEDVWVVFGVMKLAGAVGKNYGFNYMTGTFDDSEDFLDFVYQIQLRSIYNSPIKINEDDSLLMLSTCSYEINDFRTVVVARKLRNGESKNVDLSGTFIKDSVLYPAAWYNVYNGEPPIATSFADASSYGEINWYDGSLSYESPIGNTFTENNLKYKITSGSTVSLVGTKKKKLKKVYIPSEVTMGARTFEVTEIADNAFDNIHDKAKIYINKKIYDSVKTFLKSCYPDNSWSFKKMK